MYVPGQLSDVETCLVDIGTGYYIEKVWVYINLNMYVFWIKIYKFE